MGDDRCWRYGWRSRNLKPKCIVAGIAAIWITLPLPQSMERQYRMTDSRENMDQFCSSEVVDRRSGIDRRDRATHSADTNLERRRGPGRRRSDFLRSAEEGEMTNEQFLFVQAIEAFKRVNGKTFPTWTDVLEVVRRLGYRKTQTSELRLGSKAEDWTERSDAPSGVDHAAEEAA